ncbi:MAG: cytidylate kinase-like family protein [Oscillospiraceae bacterium]|jgi:cytidylate kinase|nr:cytidylate kinase-like family protein [Oscillospiraceae bacterium]
MKYTIVINREYGSGGRLIGRKLASRLGIPFYDNDLIRLTAEKSGFSEEYVKEASEKKTTSLLYSLYMTSLPVSDQLFLAQSQVVRDLAAKESCVIVGGCADYVLKDIRGLVKVFIHAPINDRIQRVRDEYNETSGDYKNYVTRMDKRRITYYRYFTQYKWGRAHDYNITLDSTAGPDTCAEIIECYIKTFLKF